MARPQPNSLPPFSSTFAAPVEPAPSTITRSMSRKTLISSRPAPSISAASSAGITRSKSGLPRARPSLDLSAVASTSTSTASTSSALPRTRTSTSLSTRASVTNTTTKTTVAPTRRRVLGEAKNSGASASESGALQGAKKTAARRMNRVDAASMTGMGIVKMGPTVKAQRSPRKVVAEGVNDPFSTSFKAPIFTFGASNNLQQATEQPHISSFGRADERSFASLPSAASTRRIDSYSAPSTTHEGLPPTSSGPFDLTSPRKRDVPRSPTKLPQLSPARRRLFGAGENSSNISHHKSPPIRRSSLDDLDEDMDIDDAMGQARASKSSKHGARGDSSDDELDFLSPRKKKRSASVSAREDQPSQPSCIRSPPKKRAITSTRAGATSVAMTRAPALQAPSTFANSVSSHTGLRRPVTAAVAETPIAPQVLSAPSRPPGLISKYAPRPPASHRQQPPATFTNALDYRAISSSSSSSTSAAARTQGAALSAVQIAQQQAQTWRSSTSSIPRSTLGSSSRSTVVSEMEVDSSMSEAGERSTFDERSRNTTITDIEEEEDEEVNSSMAAGNTSIASTVSDETSKRLANLQSMLSRLQMPRASTGSRTSLELAASSSSGIPLKSESKTLTGQFEKEYTVPLAPADEPQSTSARTRARASLPSILSSTSTAEQRGSNIALGRRRHSISTRPSTSSGMSSTSSRSGPLSSAAAPPQHQSNIRLPRRTSNIVPTSASTATIAAIADGELSAQPKSTSLQGVIAYVDVRTGGDDAGMIFVDMLKSMGARVTTRPTLSLTHIIYKSGRPGTLQRYRTHPDPKPHLVGISWVVRCAEVGQRVDEAAYAVECDKEPTFQKRRRSMEPRALAALSTNGPSVPGVQKGVETNAALKATIAASIERARRKSLQFAPKIGSPLAKRVFVMPVDQPEEEDEDMA